MWCAVALSGAVRGSISLNFNWTADYALPDRSFSRLRSNDDVHHPVDNFIPVVPACQPTNNTARHNCSLLGNGQNYLIPRVEPHASAIFMLRCKCRARKFPVYEWDRKLDFCGRFLFAMIMTSLLALQEINSQGLFLSFDHRKVFPHVRTKLNFIQC